MGHELTRQQLYDLNPQVRAQALANLIQAQVNGEIEVNPPTNLVNLHCHTCYSYNAYGHTPASLAWLAAEQGWRALATVDFDVLDAVDETLYSCDAVRVRGAAGLETRVFVPEFATREINSPGEPGICYFVGVGFTSQTAPADAAPVLAEMRRAADRRNREMAIRINTFVGQAAVDYDRDVLPLTPSGNATERHMLVAYDAAARRAFPKRADLVAFWARKLGLEPAVVESSLGAEPGPNELLRSKLMKRGGVGYVQPTPESFPALRQVSEMICACGALPTYAWLDGYSAGEQAIEELLTVMLANGVVGLTVIPERNWNFKDSTVKAEHVRKLNDTMDLAARLDLPVFIGTEMNKAGQPLVDDIQSGDALRPFAAQFIAGADLLAGHSILQRALGKGYSSSWAVDNLPERRERNAFYTRVGQIVEPGPKAVSQVASLAKAATPDDLIRELARLFS
ncbi:MAG: PHP domain-containing protein [Anaerolineae bacterium]